jgi:2-oxoisovalerate dehydrogenase E2 component (dihydrolipoyl transacylase)
MEIHVIRMPDIGEGIAEVELVAWHVRTGDTVTEDQVLADVMTDKASVEIPSPVAGTVLALGGEVGQMMAVGSELIRIELEGDAAPAPPVAPTAPSAAVVQPPTARVAAPSSATLQTGSGQPPATSATPRPLASPAVRARAWELGIDLKHVAASGTAGRVMQADLDAHLAHGGTRALPVASPLPMPPHAMAQPTATATETIKIVGLRRKIAQKMQESKRRIPHYTYVEEVDVSELEALRAKLNEKWGTQRAHLTLLAFLVRAIVLGAREFPQVNARFDDEAGLLTLHQAVHLGIATKTPAGLLVPVLRDAQAHDVWSNAAEVVRLAGLARSGKAVRDELTGSTITLTSLGRLGGIMSTPVINHPEVAIVGVNRIALRPVIRNGAVVARQMMNLSSSFDHRVVDGAQAAAFVQCLRESLEHPATLFVE